MIAIVTEPKDIIYFNLLDYLGRTCDKFSLTFHEELRKHYDAYDILDELKEYLIDVIPEEDFFFNGYSKGKVYFFRLTSNSLKIIKRKCNRLYQWQHPTLPEDLCFFDCDWKMRLLNIAHEGVSDIEIESEEELVFLKDKVGLDLYTENSVVEIK